MSTVCNLPFIGGEMGSFDPLDSGSREVASAGGLGVIYNSQFARCAIGIPSASLGIKSLVWAAQTTFWMRFDLRINGGNAFFGEVDFLYLFDGGGAKVLKMTGTFSSAFESTLKFYLEGALVGTMTVPVALQTFNIGLVLGGSTTLLVYMANTLALNLTGLAGTGSSGITQIQCRGSYAVSADNYWSQIVCDNAPHIGSFVYTYPVDTASAANTGWTGPVSAIDEVVYNDGGFVFAAAANLTSTYYASTANLANYNVLAVAVAARTLEGSGGPTHQEMVIRTNGTNYNSGSIAIGSPYEAVTNSWTTDPNTSAAWIPANAQAIEGGMETIA